MTRFTYVDDFQGDYRGVYDGRPASLSIARSRNNEFLELTFVDVDRNQTFMGLCQVPVGSRDHTLAEITLRDVADEQHTIYWEILNIHTWDIDFLSGQSLWTTLVPDPRPDLGWEMDNGSAWDWLWGFSFARTVPAHPGVG